MKRDDKVKALVDGKYLPGIVKNVEDAAGFRRSYKYQKVFVEFLDETVKEFRSYDLIMIEEPETDKKKLAKSK